MPDINSDISVGLRRYSNNLVIAGRGYILFGLWSVVKALMMITMQQEFMQNVLGTVGPSELSDKAVKLLVVIVFLVFSLIALYIHLHIGRGAVRYGKGTSSRRGFIIWGVIVSAVMIFDIPFYFTDKVQSNTIIAASIVVDITEVYILIDMMYSAHMLKRLKKEEGRETADAG